MYQKICIDNHDYVLNSENFLNILNDDVKKWLIEFLSEKKEIVVQTSGTTGPPKTLFLPKKAFIFSARRTLDFFQLKKGQKIGLCLPLHYISGKMMVIRALEGELNLQLLPCTLNPLKNLNEPLDFIAMTGAQFATVLLENPEKIKLINIFLLGGSSISENLLKKIKKLPNRFFLGYGMTETLTHMALCDLHQKELIYEILPDISIDITDENCLIVHIPGLSEPVTTSDIIEKIDHRHFRYLGRKDHLINSGGVKIIPEILEQELQKFFPDLVFIFSSLEDTILGEQLILIIEKKDQKIDIKTVWSSLYQNFSSHFRAKKIFFIKEFPRTKNGKIQRKSIVFSSLIPAPYSKND